MWSDKPIAVPKASVIIDPIPKVRSFGCAVIITVILDFSDIIKSICRCQIFKGVVEKIELEPDYNVIELNPFTCQIRTFGLHYNADDGSILKNNDIDNLYLGSILSALAI